MKVRLLGEVLLGLVLAAGAVSAQEAKTVQGEVIDPSSYLREGRHGPDTEEHVYEAVDGGQSLALLEDGTGAIYIFLGSEPGEDPSDTVYEYAGHHVKITGPVYSKGGLTGIVATNVESLEPKTQPAAAPAPASTPEAETPPATP